MSDALVCGRRFRILCVIDDFSRECVALVADTSLSGARVARALDTAIMERMAKPVTVVSDNVLCWEAAAGNGQQVSLRRSGSALLSF